MAIITIKRNAKKKPNEPLTITVPICIDNEVSAEAVQAILKVLAETPFGQLSYPINAYRYQIEPNVPENDDRVVTVGYITNYDSEEQMVTAVIFKNNREAINDLVNPAMQIVPSIHDGVFIRLQKFNILALGEDDEDDGLESPPEVPNGVVMEPDEEETDPAE